MAKSCPQVGKSNLQAVFVEIEDVSGVLQKPTAKGYILPNGQATINQTPEYTNSGELSPSLNVTAQFQDATPAGDASIPMYLRIPDDGGHMQGHALYYAAMGEVQEPDTATGTVGETDGSVTAITVASVTAGRIPPRGVVEIETEKVMYTGITESDGVVTKLTGCVRGYAGTVAASHTASTAFTLKSRVYMQDVCRPTVSIWIQNDHTVQFGSGGVVTANTVNLSNSDGQSLTFSAQFRRMGWAGRSFISGSPAGKTITVVDKDDNPMGTAYTVGAFIKNTTKKDDNSGAGYRITAVDAEVGTITVDGTVSGWADGDQIDAWLPAANPIGNALESRSARVFVDGKAGKLREGSITLNTPVTFLQEIGDEYPGEGVDGKRDLSMTLNAYFYAEEAKELGRGYEGYEVPIAVVLGGKAGQTLSLHMPRVKMNTPTVGTDGDVFTLERSGAIMGTKTSVEDAVYIVQE